MSDRKVPSLRHHKARGLAMVTLGGKDFYSGKFGSRPSRREYDRVVGEWVAAAEAAGRHDRSAAVRPKLSESSRESRSPSVNAGGPTHAKNTNSSSRVWGRSGLVGRSQ
jgi:hypothetical protein